MTAFTHERYQAQTLLNEGPTVSVWKVLDRQDGVARAMKVLDAAASPEARLAFRGEYEAARRLALPRLSAVHDFGALDDGRSYLTMELTPGFGLEALLPLPFKGVDDQNLLTLLMAGQAAIETGRLEAALNALDAAVQAAGDRQPALGFARGLRGRALADAGRFDEAQADADAAVHAGQSAGSAFLEAAARAWQAEVRLRAGDPAGALEAAFEGKAVAHALADPALDTVLGLAVAEALTASGGASHAGRHLQGVERTVLAVEARLLLAEASIALASHDHLTASRQAEAADRIAARAGLAPVTAAVALTEASVAAAEGSEAQAGRDLRRALDTAQANGLIALAAEAERRLAAPAATHEPVVAGPSRGDAEALGLITDFGRMVTGTLRYEEVLDRVIDQVMALAGAERGMIMMVDPDGAMTGVVVRPRDAAADSGEGGLMDFSGTFVKAALEARKPIWIVDAQGDERFSASASVMALDLRTVLCVPLIVEGEVIGLLYVDRQSVSSTFTEADLHLVEGLAGFAALSIMNARRYEDARQHADELAAAQALSRLAGGRLGFSEVLAAIASGVASVLPAERLVVLLGDDPYPTLALDAAGVPVDTQVNGAIVERVVATREAIVERDAHDMVSGAARQVLAAPLVVGDELLGALYLVRPEDARPFTPREVGLIETLTAHAAPALDAVATREGLSRQVERLEGLVGSMQTRMISRTEGDDLDFGDL